jgi:hypothetical protein
VLIVGGFDGRVNLSSVELFDPHTLKFSGAGLGSMSSGRWGPVAAPLPNGKVLVAGGIGTSGISSSAELFDPATGTFSSSGIGAMTAGRMQPAAAPLPNGDVLIAGGAGAQGELSSAELFTFPPAASPPGLSGRITLSFSKDVTRVVKRGGHKVRVTRKVRTTSVVKATALFTTTPAYASLTGGTLTYATGTAELTRLALDARRQVPDGRYSLTLRHPYGRRWLTRRVALVIGR